MYKGPESVRFRNSLLADRLDLEGVVVTHVDQGPHYPSWEWDLWGVTGPVVVVQEWEVFREEKRN